MIYRMNWCSIQLSNICWSTVGLRIKETKEVYEGEVMELTPVETENPMGGKFLTLCGQSSCGTEGLAD